MTKYWVGTMNRMTTSEGENSVPVNPKYWEEEKKNWREVTEEEYKKAYAVAWEKAENSFWHC